MGNGQKCARAGSQFAISSRRSAVRAIYIRMRAFACVRMLIRSCRLRPCDEHITNVRTHAHTCCCCKSYRSPPRSVRLYTVSISVCLRACSTCTNRSRTRLRRRRRIRRENHWSGQSPRPRPLKRQPPHAARSIITRNRRKRVANVRPASPA